MSRRRRDKPFDFIQDKLRPSRRRHSGFGAPAFGRVGDFQAVFSFHLDNQHQSKPFSANSMAASSACALLTVS